ncbi:MAG: DUF5721 family protein [Cellulosilyticaceae bacterium]
MESYTIDHKKEFMAKLLKSDLFDSFEVREVIIHTAFKCIVDGTRNKDFFFEEDNHPTTTYLSWQELRSYIYSLMQGSKLPTYFKIILSTTSDKTMLLSPDVSAFFLNITFKDNILSCSTGIAYKTFSLDKTPEILWDEKMKQFLFKYNFL